MKNYVKILAVSAVALSLGACNIATIAPLAGAGIGGLGGAAIGNQFGQGKGKTLATIAGAPPCTGCGYKTRQFVSFPFPDPTYVIG